MTFAEFTRLVDQFPRLERAVLHGIGEPLLNRELAPMIRYLKERNVHVVFNTNAILLYPKRQVELAESGLDELRVSCDGSTPETYATMRGVNVLPKVLRNVGQMMETRRRLNVQSPRVSLFFTGARENIEELPGVIDHAIRLGVDEVTLTRMVFFGEGLATEDQSIYNAGQQLRQRVTEIVEDCVQRAAAAGLSFKGAGALAPNEYAAGPQAVDRPWQGCRRPWRLGYVTANGNALPCCIAPFTGVPYDDIILGNVNASGSFAEVWNSDRYDQFRRQHQSGNPPDACRSCGLDWSL